jgi:cytosine/adenosine deaminase-related metal-dependent hydrolase
MKILTARYVLPITSAPIDNGAVAIDGDAIIGVGKRDEIDIQFPSAAIEDFGEAAIIPGFVNCHSHLEITALRGALDRVEHDFYLWLITLTKLRGDVLDQDDIEVAAVAGAIEGARAGVTCFGDIGRFGRAGFEALKTVGLRGVLFQETDFSPDDATALDDFEKLKDKYLALRETATELVEVGLSPHAPYTVSRRLFEEIARYALDAQIKISTHAAESREEDELMRAGTGFFTTVYERFGVDWASPLCSSIEFLNQTGILATRPLLAHCITVTDSDIEIVAANGASVAHCPKSNAKFGHGYAPFEKIVDAGISVGLGTDSVASNNIVDMFEEGRLAAFASRNRADRRRFVSAEEVLSAATLGGAKSLGLADKIGSLECGKKADLAVINLTNIGQRPVSDIYAALVFSTSARDVSMTMVAGADLYREGRLSTVDEKRIRNRLSEVGEKLRTPAS